MSGDGESIQVSCEVAVNGETRNVIEGSNLTQLVEDLGLHPQAVAVELNGSIIERAR